LAIQREAIVESVDEILVVHEGVHEAAVESGTAAVIASQFAVVPAVLCCHQEPPLSSSLLFQKTAASTFPFAECTQEIVLALWSQILLALQHNAFAYLVDFEGKVVYTSGLQP